MGRFLAYSLLIDPVHVWRDGIEPFVDGGDPAFGLLQSAKAQGETLSEFSFEPHFALVDGAAARHDDLLKAFRATVGPLDDPEAVKALTVPA